MSHKLFVLAAFTLFPLVAISQGGPTVPIQQPKTEVRALGSQVFNVERAGRQRACAIALGDGNTYVGLYVYDIHGNCVAWDDEGAVQTCDDVAVEWYPARNAVYQVEVHNSGLQPNTCK